MRGYLPFFGHLLANLVLFFAFYSGFDQDIWLASINAAATYFCAWVLGLWLRAYYAARKAETALPDRLHLASKAHREIVQAKLAELGVVGSANIREGLLCPVVLPQELGPLAKRFRSIIASLGDGRLPIPYNLYRAVKRDGEETGWRYEALDLGLPDLCEAASVIERVVEDRKASRSLYKGLGDDELLAMARTAVASLYRSKKLPDIAMSYERGECDHMPGMEVAKATIELIFRVKAATL